MISFFIVVAFLLLAVVLVKVAYRPRGTEALKAQLERSRNALQAIDTEVRDAQENANAKRAKLEQEIGQLTRGLGKPGVQAPDEEKDLRANVVVQTLTETTLLDKTTLPAFIEGQTDILLPAKNDGVLEWVGVKEGEKVRKGQLIAKIDATTWVEQRNRAEAAERLARVNLRRVENLAKEKVASFDELDRAHSEWEQAKASLSIASKSLADSSLVSPIDGVLDDWTPDVGEFVHRGDGIARVVDLSTVKASANVPEQDVSYFRLGQPTRVENPAPTEGFTTATISRIRLVAEDQSKTFRLEASVDNGRGIFRPGMITRVELLRRNHSHAIVIPFFTVLQTQDGPVVYLERNGKAEARKITIGIRQGMMLEVTGGLKVGDRLIVSGQRTLGDGTPVRVVEKQL